MAPKMGEQKGMKISVIIPARNEEKYIESCIRSVKLQNFSDYEIIVVDNGSTDKTAEIAKTLGVRVVSEPKVGLPRAREKGREIANGDLLVYLDADMKIPPLYLSRIFEHFEKHGNAVAVSNPFFFYDGNWRINVLTRFFFKIFFPIYCKSLKVLTIPRVLFGANFAIRREALEKIGGFDNSLEFYGEDTDISKRISKEGDIDFISDLCTFTSARRYTEQGILKTTFVYFANYFFMLLFNRPISLPNFRLGPIFKYGTISVSIVMPLIYGLVYPKSEIFGHVIHGINSRSKVVALTFDDGPNGKYTEQVLDILRNENIKGTFFLIGKNVEVYPNIAREIVRQGHCVGNHSYTHPWLLPVMRKKALVAEVNKAETAIYNATGVRPVLFRPPHGLRTPWMISTIRKMGYEVITWDDMTTDYFARSKPKKIAKRIISRVRPGSIIVLHDGLNLNHGVNRENMIEALKIIIPALKEKGYKFVSLKNIALDSKRSDLGFEPLFSANWGLLVGINK